MTEEEFFYQLLSKTRDTFLKSQTYQKFQDKNWNSAVCETPITKNQGLFFGLNWGGNNIGQQTGYPAKHRKRTFQFISHSRKYFRKYFEKEIEDLNYSNFCFFRTPKANLLVDDDWQLTYPLFKEYIDFINPPWALMLGQSDYVLNNHVTDKNKFSVWDKNNNKTVNGCFGTLFNKYPFGNVPHPQAKISTESRNEIWSLVTEKLPKNKI